MTKRPYRCAWLALLFVACQWLAPSAVAPLRVTYAAVPGVTCAAQMTSITFGNIDEGYYDQNYNLSTAGYITYYCQNTTPTNQTITACFSIGNPGGGASRTLANGNKAMDYQLYQDASGTIPWGSTSLAGLGNPYKDNVMVPANGRSAPKTLPVYAVIDANQSFWLWIFQFGLPAGTYSTAYGANDVSLDIASGSGAPCASGGGTISGFNVSATIKQTCQVTASTLDFGTIPGDPSGATADTTLDVSCVGNTSYRVGLDDGKNAAGGTRRMRGGPTHEDFIPYQLCQNASCSKAWGNDDGTSNVVTASKASQTFRVYGKIPPNQGLPPAGNYFDAVTVYVYY